MANTYKDIIITPNRNSNTADPNISFRGANTGSNTEITLRVYPDSNGTLSFEGSAGQLFSITNDLTGSIYSVNDISGIPSIEVFANGVVRLAQYSGNVVIGNTTVISTNTATTTTQDVAVTVDTFATTTFRTAVYQAQLKRTSPASDYETITLSVIHDGTTVYLSQYGQNKTNSSANMGLFDAAIATGTLSLTFKPNVAVVEVKTVRNAILV